MKTKQLVSLLLLVIVALGAYIYLNKPDQRTLGDKIGDAVDTLDKGGNAHDAARELKDRTPGDRLKDQVDDATKTKSR